MDLQKVLVGCILKTKKEYKKLNKKEIQDVFIKKECGKACFQHDMAYGDVKDLPRRMDKAFNIAKYP